MTSTITIDRIEHDLAVVESGTQYFSIPVSLLPQGIKEGDSLTMTFSVQENPPSKEANERLERLKKRDPGDDIIDL